MQWTRYVEVFMFMGKYCLAPEFLPRDGMFYQFSAGRRDYELLLEFERNTRIDSNPSSALVCSWR